MRKMVFTVSMAALAALSLLVPTAGMAQTHLIADADGPADTYEWATIGIYTSYADGGGPDNPDLGATSMDVSSPGPVELFIVVSYINADDGGVDGQEFLESIGAMSFMVSWDNTTAAGIGGVIHADGINASSDTGVFEFGFTVAQPYDDPAWGADHDHSMLLVSLTMLYTQATAQEVNFYLEPSPAAQIFEERMIVVDGNDPQKYLWMRPSSASSEPASHTDAAVIDLEYDEPVFAFNAAVSAIEPATWSNVKALWR